MKNKYLKILSCITIAFVLFIGTSNFCYASGIAIGNESVTVSFYGVDSGVYYLIADPQGRRTGYDPVSKQTIEEFPAAFDFSLKIRDEISEMFHGSADFNLIPGTYTVEVIGVGLTTFDMNVRISRRLPSEGPTGIDFKTLKLTSEQIAAIKALSSDFVFKGVIDKDLTSKFQFTYTSDPSKPSGTATKIVEPGSLKQDITLSRKIGWIDSDGIMNSLLKKAEEIDASIEKGNREAAKNQLNAFINEVHAQKGKHISYYTDDRYTKKGSELIKLPPETGEAVKILLEDAQYLLNQLEDSTSIKK